MKENNKSVPDVYQMVTDRIIAALEKGVIPWKQPWKESGLPRNLITGKVYRGINFWLLLSANYPSNYFLSFKQIKELGGKVKEGEKSHIIVFWKQLSMEDPETKEKKNFPFLRYYTVFNIDQCENLPEYSLPEEEANQNTLLRNCEEIVEAMPQKPVIRHKDNRAYYNPLRDFINMPALGSFINSDSYYAVLFHEMIHSTGHSNRLKRKELLEMAEFGSETYSIEELIAEIGSCYLVSIADITQDGLENQTAYIKGWLNKLRNDKKFIVYASTQAQKATDFILNLTSESQAESISEESIPGDNQHAF